jgi:UrcA family protein
MLKFSSLTSPMRVALLATAFGFGLAASASAQEYDRDGNQLAYHDNSVPLDEITITAPRHRPERSAIGAPIEDVALSEAVRYDDLDLTTDRGIHRLHERISDTARQLCRRLDETHPIAVSDSPPCYRTAMENAAPMAIAAIDRANAQAQNGSYDDRYIRYDSRGDNY